MGRSALDMRWWGWGEGAGSGGARLSSAAIEELRTRLGVVAAAHPRAQLEEVRLPAAALSAATRQRLVEIVGPAGLGEDHATRVRHAAGRGYPDLVSLRCGRPEGAPDAVVYPACGAQVAALLKVCADEGIAVVPWGGGTSVVGGVAPLRGTFAAVVVLDLRRLDRLVDLDDRSLVAVVQAGMRGPALENALGRRGLTLGHFPQSYEWVSVGGCVATRSAGQASSGYGRVEEMVLGLRCETPAGEVVLPAVPATAAGPDLRELFVGSEGTLGVITEVTLRVRRRPRRRRYEGMFFRSFVEGCEALRAVAQGDVAPTVTRLSDEPETSLSMLLAGGDRLKARVAATYLAARGYAGGCLAILGWEGEHGVVTRARTATLEVLRVRGGLGVGAGPGNSWARGRYAGPYLRDELLGLGVMVETLETATTWSKIPGLYASVRQALHAALRRRGTPGIVMCHVSHVYETGASLYFTFLARQEAGAEIEQWRAAKVAASEAIVAAGATITHHHAVGRDHAPWLGAETGPVGLAALAALKRELDPAGIMNPGKLLAR